MTSVARKQQNYDIEVDGSNCKAFEQLPIYVAVSEAIKGEVTYAFVKY